MPRRGEYTAGFPASRAPESTVGRIGIRQVVAQESNQAKAELRFDPSRFTCAQLAAELADEWAELVIASGMGATNARVYRQAIREFCTHVDATLPRSEQASLARADPDLHVAITEWCRLLPSGYAAGSRAPGLLAGKLRTLIRRRLDHRDRPVAGHLRGWIEGHIGVRRGQTNELDEFAREDKKKLVQAAWMDHLAIQARLKRGWELAATGADPAGKGWSEPADLLWAIAHDAWTIREVSQHLPPWRNAPAALRAFMPDEPENGTKGFVRFLVHQLFLSGLDLQSYRILLMAATGRAPEEVAALDEDDLEYGPHGVTIDFSKGRAHKQMRQSFSPVAEGAPGVLYPSAPKVDAVLITRQLLELSRPLAHRAGLSPVPLFLRTSITDGRLSAVRMNRSSGSFTDWLTAKNVSVAGTADIRRLRKSGKVEKAITYKGRISDIADDHSQQTFRGHYAHGTTLRVIAGDVITAAQRRWFTQALDGPTVLSQEAQHSLQQPGRAAALGLTAQEVEQLRAGALDMGVSSCKDPFGSPYGRPGQLCPVAPTRCMECRNAFILPSNLPQLLLFAAHLERLRLRLSPRHFHALWGQSIANLREAIGARSDAEIAEARRQIAEDGITLQLPLAAHVEFDA